MASARRGVLTSWKQIPAPGNRIEGKINVIGAHTEGQKVHLALRVWPVGHPGGIEALATIDSGKSTKIVAGSQSGCQLELILADDGVRVVAARVGDLRLPLKHNPAAAEAP